MASMRYEVTFNEANQKNQVVLTALLTETRKLLLKKHWLVVYYHKKGTVTFIISQLFEMHLQSTGNTKFILHHCTIYLSHFMLVFKIAESERTTRFVFRHY